MRALVIFGPGAVGKMTVGRAVCARSSFRLFHNHHTIEPLHEVFGFGSRAFEVLNREFRRRVFEEAARDGLDLVWTAVWMVEDPAERDYLAELLTPYAAAGAPIAFVELAADLDTRLDRNRTEHRLAEKRSKRDLEWSDRHVRELESVRANTIPGMRDPAHDLLDAHPHLRLDTTELTAEQAAGRILDWLAEVAPGE